MMEGIVGLELFVGYEILGGFSKFDFPEILPGTGLPEVILELFKIGHQCI